MMLSVPKIDHYVSVLKRFHYNSVDRYNWYDDKTYVILDEIFKLLKTIKPISEYGVRKLWFKAERRPIEDFGDYEEMKEMGDVESYEEYKEMWLDYYPEEEKWYNFCAVEHEDIKYRAIIINNRQVIEHDKKVKADSFPYDISEFAEWILESVKNCIKMLEEGTYNDYVNANIPSYLRTGTIVRKDYWDIFPEERDEFLEDIKKEDINAYLKYISEQPENPKDMVGRIPKMTANKFYEFCAKGYAANKYDKTDLSPKEQYFAHADGRDNGLSEIDPNSPEAFDEWIDNRTHFGGHPWEVCRGVNSTHIDLYVDKLNDGYVLAVSGYSRVRTIEAIKFYLALKRNGLPVFMYKGHKLADRLTEKEKIGIVPKGVIPVYCESMFPDEDIISFMNLPDEKAKEIETKVVWQKLDTISFM